jgi:hypothetical protein
MMFAAGEFEACAIRFRLLLFAEFFPALYRRWRVALRSKGPLISERPPGFVGWLHSCRSRGAQTAAISLYVRRAKMPNKTRVASAGDTMRVIARAGIPSATSMRIADRPCIVASSTIAVAIACVWFLAFFENGLATPESSSR